MKAKWPNNDKHHLVLQVSCSMFFMFYWLSFLGSLLLISPTPGLPPTYIVCAPRCLCEFLLVGWQWVLVLCGNCPSTPSATTPHSTIQPHNHNEWWVGMDNKLGTDNKLGMDNEWEMDGELGMDDKWATDDKWGMDNESAGHQHQCPQQWMTN